MRQMSGFCAALVLSTIWGCSARMDNTDAGLVGDTRNIPGNYVTEASGNTLGKRWSYSGALVLDSTKSFGAVFTVQAGEGGAERTSLHGTYRVSTSTRRRSRSVSRTVKVILYPSDRGSDTHTLLFHGDSLTFDGGWWAGAALSALGVGNPVFVRVADTEGADSSKAAASSTPVSAAQEKAANPRRSTTSMKAAK